MLGKALRVSELEALRSTVKETMEYEGLSREGKSMRKAIWLKYTMVFIIVVVVPFAVGSLGLTESVISDEFSTDEVDVSIWETVIRSEYGTIDVQDGKLYMTIHDAEDVAEVRISTQDALEGDFDIQVDWEVQIERSDTGRNGLWVVVDGENLAYIARAHFGNNNLILGSVVDRGYTGDTPVVSTSTRRGKFRITRTGRTIRLYYDTGRGWELLGEYDRVFTDQVYVWLDIASFDSCPDVIALFDNFIAQEVN